MTPTGETALVVTCVLPDDADAAPILARLPSDVAETIARQRSAADRLSRAVAHLLLRQCLVPFVGSAPLSFERDRFGRPFLKDDQGGNVPTFSLSHTRGAIAVAIATTPGSAIGVDIEPVAQPVSRSRVADALSSAEQRALADMDEAARAEAFVAIWTLKEAAAKADGRGLTWKLDSYSVDPLTLTLALNNAVSPSPAWRLDQRRIGDWMVAVALHTPAAPERVAWNIAWCAACYDELLASSINIDS